MMNRSIGCQTGDAYNRVQQSLEPSKCGEALQVDESLARLRTAQVELHEMTMVLLRRLEPVTGPLPDGDGCGTVQPTKVPLAASLDDVTEGLGVLFDRVQTAVKALQI